jgi:hypothetical protein
MVLKLILNSLVMHRIPRSYTKAIADLYCNEDYPSYGYKFEFNAADSVTLNPIELNYNSTKSIITKVILNNETTKDTLIVGGKISRENESYKVIPAKILLKP